MNRKHIMKKCTGFSLIEVLVAIVIIGIAALGFMYSVNVQLRERGNISRMIAAQTMLQDVAERLTKLPKTNALVLPASGNEKYIGYYVAAGMPAISECQGASPKAVTDQQSRDFSASMTRPNSANGFYLFDNGAGTVTPGVTITSAANPNIDHPNAVDISSAALIDTLNSTVGPIRRDQYGITYYAVWKVAYMPCTGTSDQAKIFVTVYWLEPASPATVAEVVTRINNGSLRVRSVSLTVDRSFRTEL